MKIEKEAPHRNLAVGRRDGGVLMSDLLILDASPVFLRSGHFVGLVRDEIRARVMRSERGKRKNEKWGMSGKVIPK